MRRVAGFRLAALGLVAVTAYGGVLWFVLARYRLPPLVPSAWALLLGSLMAQFAAKWAFGLLFQDGVSEAGGVLPAPVAFRAALVGAGVARLIPAGGAMTPVAMAWSVRRQVRGTGGAAVRATVLNYAGLLAGTGFCLLWVRGRRLYQELQAGTVVAGIIALVIGLLLMFGTGWLGTIGRKLPLWARRRLGHTLLDHPPDARAQLFLWTRLLLEAAALALALEAFGIHLTPSQVGAAFGISQLFGGLPGTPGGLGLTEAGLVGALAAFGFAPGLTVAPVLVYRLVSYWLPAAASLFAGGTSFLRSPVAEQALDPVLSAERTGSGG